MVEVDLLSDARSLVDEADRRGLTARLLGGLAIRARVPWWAGRPAGRRPDIDLAIRSAERTRLSTLLVELGYTADRRHNALHGDRQLYFFHPQRGHAIDVIVDRLVMCHTLDLRDRLSLDPLTLPAADLLLSKLQVVRLNDKDASDALALLSAHELADRDADGIAIDRILAITSHDWGWWRTVAGTLAKLALLAERDMPQAHGLDEPRRRAALDRVAHLVQLMADAPKSVGWRARAVIGERIRWYEEPEEVDHMR
jgi:hypothetical protein